MGSPQLGLPHPSAIPKKYHILIIDIKDCFFSIPLHPNDREKFAFTVPLPNHQGANARYQWTVLPQGMRNSPAMCQNYVNQAIEPLRSSYYVIHYMDDILIAHSEEEMLIEGLNQLKLNLQQINLTIKEEKVQKVAPFTFLGYRITSHINPISPQLETPEALTLTELQQLCGHINWIRTSIPITTQDLDPLFQLLKTPGHPSNIIHKKIKITPAAKQAIEKVSQALSKAVINRYNPEEPILALVLKTLGTPTGVLWQNGPLLWVHLSKSRIPKLLPLIQAFISLASDLVTLCRQRYNVEPARIIWPLNKEQTTTLLQENYSMQVLKEQYTGDFDTHYPSSKLLQGLTGIKLMEQNHAFPSGAPIPHATVVFTDASKRGFGFVAYTTNKCTPSYQAYKLTNSVQRGELHAIIATLQTFSQEPLNIFSDSQYACQVCKTIAYCTFFPTDSPLDAALVDLKKALEHRHHPWYISHVRSHTSLPGAIAEGNHLVDSLVSALLMQQLTVDPISQAKNLHARFHFSAASLKHLLPDVPLDTCKHLVRLCKTCAPFLPLGPLQPQGVNPRGLKPNARWQMDVTHIPTFARLKYVHVIIDTYSHLTYAAALASEKARHCIKALRQAILFMGVPWDLKTDNGPAYTSREFQNFIRTYNITHHFGIPYNPQGQAIVENTHHRLKVLIEKERGIQPQATPDELLTSCLIHLNLMTFDKNGLSPMHKHWGPSIISTPLPLVYWKNPESNNWQGPSPLLTQGRGFACIFPDNVPQPIWIPGRNVRPATGETKPTQSGSMEAVPEGPPADASSPTPDTTPQHVG